MPRLLAIALVVLLALSAGVYAWLALIHAHVEVRPIDGARVDLDDRFATVAATTFFYLLIIGGGVATLALWAYRFVRGRLRRRGPWDRA